MFLEESSAERIIREYLIPWFVPELQAKLRTFSARSLSEIKKKFADFNNLFVFLHLQPNYTNKAWVITDGGSEEKEIIDKLKDTYVDNGWGEDHFMQFNEHDFERYYPNNFQEAVTEILALSGSQKHERKKLLLEEVVIWCEEDKERAKKAFEESAKEVIGILQSICKDL